MRRSTTALALACGLCVSACASRRLELPSGGGTSFPGFAAAYSSATQGCGTVRTMTAEIGVSGKVGAAKVRGRVLAGFARPSSLRLEGVAPFGPPAFILAAGGTEATLLLPRDRAVLQGETPGKILDALIGVDMSPEALLSVLSGCPIPAGEAVAGHSFPGGLLRIDFGDGGQAFLRSAQDGTWVLVASLAGQLRVDYGDRERGTPAEIRLLVEAGSSGVDLRLRVADADVNVDLAPAAFDVRVPEGAEKITLEELRRAGPLAGR